MKTIGITIAIIFATLQMFASDLILTSNNSKPFSATIDGRTYHSHRGEISVSNLAPGNYRVAIFSQQHQHKGNNVVQNIHIPAQSIVYATVRPNNTVSVARIEQVRVQKTYVQSRPAQAIPVHTPRIISARDFDNLYNHLASIRFDTDRARAARNAIAIHTFSAAQAYDIVSLFNFEDLRLEIAKLAYNKTVDPHNYYQVFELMSFESSKRELDRYMGNTKYYQPNSYTYSYHR